MHRTSKRQDLTRTVRMWFALDSGCWTNLKIRVMKVEYGIVIIYMRIFQGGIFGTVYFKLLYCELNNYTLSPHKYWCYAQSQYKHFCLQIGLAEISKTFKLCKDLTSVDQVLYSSQCTVTISRVNRAKSLRVKNRFAVPVNVNSPGPPSQHESLFFHCFVLNESFPVGCRSNIWLVGFVIPSPPWPWQTTPTLQTS